MNKFLLAIVLMATLPSYAHETPASEASIRELLNLTDSKKLLDQTYAQIDDIMAQGMKQGLGDAKLNPEQEQLMADLRADTVELIRQEMGWEKLEPMYIELYAKSFSQSEVDGMLAFYKTDAGQAVLAKLPVLMQNVMQQTMGLMTGLMPRLRTLVNDYLPRIKKAGSKSG